MNTESRPGREIDLELCSSSNSVSGGPMESVQIAREQQPVLALMDIQLPGISGVEALQKLRADALTRAVPLIAVTPPVMPNTKNES